MANGDIMPSSFFRFPAFTVPSWMEDIEEMLPTTNLINGLSVSEDDKNIYVEAALPGIDPKDVEVTFDKGLLAIRGEKKEEEKGKRYQRRATRSFLYRVQVAEVDTKAEPTAKAANGMMTITLPKIPEAKPKRIPIKAG